MNHCKKCGNNIPDHVNDCDEAGFGEDCGNKIATTPTVEEIVRTLAMALTHSEQGHYDKNEALVRDTISPLVSNTETTNTMTQDTPTVEEAFTDGFSFEGNNDPEDTPKMLFVKHEDGTKSIATPEYVIAFAKAYATTYGQSRFEEGVKAERERASEKVKKLGLSRRMKVAETQFALKQLRKQQPELTMHDIAIHNAEAEGYNDGYEKAMSRTIDALTDNK